MSLLLIMRLPDGRLYCVTGHTLKCVTTPAEKKPRRCGCQPVRINILSDPVPPIEDSRPRTADEIIRERIRNVRSHASKSVAPKRVLACRLVQTASDDEIDNVPMDGSPTPRWKNAGVKRSECSEPNNPMPDPPNDCNSCSPRNTLI